jgi:hypothetical protein
MKHLGSNRCKPGLAPAGDSLSLASPRESKQREGDPMVWVPSLRCGQPAVLAESGVELELAALRQSLALIRFRLRSSAQPDGWGNKCGGGFGEARTRFARPRRSPMAYPNPIPNPALTPPPFCMRRGAEGQTDQGERLSEPKASSSSTPAGPSTAGCPRSDSEGGRRQQGRLSLAYFSLARQRKVSCRRATPGLLNKPTTASCSPESTISEQKVPLAQWIRAQAATYLIAEVTPRPAASWSQP